MPVYFAAIYQYVVGNHLCLIFAWWCGRFLDGASWQWSVY